MTNKTAGNCLHQVMKLLITFTFQPISTPTRNYVWSVWIKPFYKVTAREPSHLDVCPLIDWHSAERKHRVSFQEVWMTKHNLGIQGGSGSINSPRGSSACSQRHQWLTVNRCIDLLCKNTVCSCASQFLRSTSHTWSCTWMWRHSGIAQWFLEIWMICFKKC